MISFFGCLNKDIDILLQPKAENDNDVGVRIVTVALRIFGLLFIGVGIFVFVASLIVPNPNVPIFLRIFAVFAILVIGHDICKMGSNTSKILDLGPEAKLKDDLILDIFYGTIMIYPGCKLGVSLVSLYSSISRTTQSQSLPSN